MPIEGTFRSHQVPLSDPATASRNICSMLEEWLRSYRPEELFDEHGRLKPELAELAPTGERRMGANPHANGGMLLRDLRMPDFRDYASDVRRRASKALATRMCSGDSCATSSNSNAERRTFASSVRMRRCPTDWKLSLKRRIGNGRRRPYPTTNFLRPPGA